MKFSIWAIIAAVIVLLIIEVLNSTSTTSTRIFCAYNRTFVEFEEKGHVWGTMMLDFNGKPITCKENIEVETKDTI